MALARTMASGVIHGAGAVGRDAPGALYDVESKRIDAAERRRRLRGI